jgi:hypothetical protein
MIGAGRAPLAITPEAIAMSDRIEHGSVRRISFAPSRHHLLDPFQIGEWHE